MNKILIEYIIRLFSIISNIYSAIPRANVKDFISAFLKKEFSHEAVKEFLVQFDTNYNKYQQVKSESSESLSDILISLTREVNDKLPKWERFMLLIRLLLFNNFLLRYPFHKADNRIRLSDLLKQISNELNIEEKEFENCKSFVEEKLYNLNDKQNLLLLCEKKPFNIDINILEKQGFKGQLYFLIVKSINLIIFYYKGSQNITLNNQIIFPENIYVFPSGSSIKGDNIEPIFYNQILRKFLTEDLTHLCFQANDIDFRFKNSKNGIHDLNVSIESGQLVGVIGRSGVGKSTLLSLLNGSMTPQKGSVTINSFDIAKDKNKLEGIIGYIPQDDLLIEELSVFKNLYLNAKLCFGDLTNEEIKQKVERLLKDLDLFDVKELRVGTPLNKYISGGQRKRLNIALELIREPYILFADEPTSGLSSSDSEEIMHLFSEQTIKGRIVVMNIHQPSSETFKSFDKILLLDKEGYPVYFGNPVESISYFNNLGESFVTVADSCQKCGNVNPESIFKILEERKVNKKGEFVAFRKVNPEQWHEQYKIQLSKTKNNKPIEDKIPDIKFKRPSVIKQFLIFSERNFLSKFANKQYVLLAFLITPVLSIILSFLCKHTSSDFDHYVLFGNENIPAYLFMGVIVALFVGLIISAEDIYRDRKILKREAFLRLNKLSYLKSKILFLFVLSAIQSFLFVLLGNWILGIEGMLFYYWIILFSTFSFANVVGLVISSLFNSIVVIYILVPLFIVPQILLSGTMVQYDKLNTKVVNNEFVPIVGDIMGSRWAYEALVVAQFKDNKYQKLYFDFDKKDSYARFNVLFLIPELKESKDDLYEALKNDNLDDFENEYNLLISELKKLSLINPFKELNDFSYKKLTYNELHLVEGYLNTINSKFIKLINDISYKKDSVTHSLISKLGDIKSYNEFKNNNSVKSLSDLVLKRQSFKPFVRLENKIIRKIEPIYHLPDSKLGRAHFFASEKRIGSLLIDTVAFNLIILWLMTFMLCILLTIIFYRKF
ncbi:MAG: ATP-binding cassette domain-containing protein [Bacteroidales bacterium]|nr:ATP-binding cassette domain-containing protein [Bacteroidales bacterium]